MNRRRFTTNMVVALGLATLAVVPAVQPAAALVDKTVVMAGAVNHPAVVVLQTGEKITWTNVDPIGHNVAPNPTLGPTVGGSFAVTSPILQTLQSWSCAPAGSYTWRCDRDKNGQVRTITMQPGRYAYLCKPHETWQHGVIVVV